MKLDKNTDHGRLEPLFRGVVDAAVIAEQWGQLVRVAASLKDRTAPAHAVLQRPINALSAGPGLEGADRLGTGLQDAVRPALDLRRAEIDPADLAHVWPLHHARIIPNGAYFLGWPQDFYVR